MPSDERSPLLNKKLCPQNVPVLSVPQLARLVTFASSFSEGWEISIFSVILVPVTKTFGLTSLEIGLLASLPLVAGIFGYILMGWLMDTWGRKPAIMLTYVICATGCLIMANAHGIIVLGIGRCVMSLGIKAGVICVSVYMAELSPAAHRGALVSLEEIYLNIGILSASFAAWLLMGLDMVSWRAYVMFGACAPLVALLLILVLRVPESPRFLHQQGRETEALVILRSALEGNEAEVQQILVHWGQDAEAMQVHAHKTIADHLREIRQLPSHHGFRIATCCWIARAGSGISIIGAYLMILLSDMNEETSLRWYTAANAIKTLALIPSVLWLIDAYGRRALFLTSAIACALAMAVAAALRMNHFPPTAVAICLIMYFSAFSIGYGPVVWVYCFEILPSEQRGKAASVSMIPGDLCAFVLLTLGPLLIEYHKALPYVLVGFTNLLAACFFFASCPETKGLLLEVSKDAKA